MEDKPPSSSLFPDTSTDSNPTVGKPPPNDHKKPSSFNYRKKKKTVKEFIDTPASSSSSASAFSSTQRSSRLAFKRRNTKVVFAPVRRGYGGGGFVDSAGDVDAIALPLGMSFAAIVAQVLERKDVVGGRMSVDQLSMICTSAVRESLANVFGDKFNFFVKNFEKSFGSTLKTLRLINESSNSEGAHHLRNLNVESSVSDVLNRTVDFAASTDTRDCGFEKDIPSILSEVPISEGEEETSSTDCLNQELALHGQINQLVRAPSSLVSGVNELSIVEKSVIEQTRSNDLKTLEIGLTMKKLRLKETELALSFDANHLERSKLAMGVSKASFKAEKFKTQLEDTRHAELHKMCIDCLVAGLFIMSASLFYGAYVYSYRRITEATTSCSPSPEGSMSWWMPKTVSTLNSGYHTLKCQVQVLSRMLFGLLMILVVAYLLLQRSATSQQTMPVTFILFLLGGACGFAGKLCVDTLGGNGSLWLLQWEILCLVHFFSIVCTSTLLNLVYGPITVCQGVKQKAMYVYRCRQILFYTALLLILPLCCGLLPFAGPGEWTEHFMLLFTDFFSISD